MRPGIIAVILGFLLLMGALLSGGCEQRSKCQTTTEKTCYTEEGKNLNDKLDCWETTVKKCYPANRWPAEEGK